MGDAFAGIQRRYFFDSGVRFACTGCGACCTGAPGKVRVSPDEIEALAAKCGIHAEQFKADYTRTVEGECLLNEEDDGRCVFFRDGCSVYEQRPMQCRTYPFWFRHLRSEEAWRDAAASCPGIGQGRLYSRDEILENLSRSPV